MLKTVANALKITSQQMGGFVARYGGNEFCYILSGRDIAPDLVKSCIRKNLEEMQMKEQQNKDYSLLVSIGYNTISNAETDIINGIVLADKLLYEDKNREINSK